jgi:hypothetical protein
MDFFKCSGWRKSMAITDPVVTEKRARGTAAASFAFNSERAGLTQRKAADEGKLLRKLAQS